MVNLLRQQHWIYYLTIALIGGAVTGCRGTSMSDSAQGQGETLSVEERLAFQDIVLEQANAQGQRLWEVRGKRANYQQTQKVAHVASPKGELFQDGKVAYRFTAQEAILRQDSEQIILKGQVVATAVASNAVLRGKFAEWNPKSDLFVVRDRFSITHAKANGTAQEGQVFSRTHRVELIGGVSAVMQAPALTLQTEALTWNMAQQMITGDRPVRVERYQGTQRTDWATGNQIEASQQKNSITLSRQARVHLHAPPLDVASDSLHWDLNTQRVTSDVSMSVHHRAEVITLRASQGWIDIPKQIFYLTGTVHGVGQKQDATLKSQKLTWYIPTKDFIAEGNVLYQQQNPRFTSRGPVARGKFQDQQVKMSGGNRSVVTQIIPSP
jgi:LPS export ABC transporter protein LptC